MNLKTEIEMFWKQNKSAIIFAVLISFIAFGTMLIYPTLSIDEETSILADNSYHPWISQERFGIQLFNEIFTVKGRFVPFLSDVLAILLWNFSGIVLAFTLLWKNVKIKSFPLFAFLAYYGTLPFVAGESLGFSQMSIQTGIGIVFMSFAALFTREYLDESGTKESRRKNFMWMILTVFVSLSMYQAMITVYVTALVFLCIQRVLDGKLKILYPLVSGALVSVIGFVLYMAVSKFLEYILHSPASYIDSYVGWFEDSSILHAAGMAIANVARVSFAITIQDVEVYGGVVIRITSILFILCSILLFAKTTKKGSKPRILFLTIAAMFAPFSIYILLGTYKTQGRMLLALQLVGAMALYYMLVLCEAKRKIKYVGIVLTLYLLVLNVRNLNTINYYGYLRYEQDRTTMNQVMYDMARLGYDYHKKPIVFIGSHENDFYGTYNTSSTLGASGSFLTWDGGNKRRMRNFLKTEGYNIILPTKAEMKQAVDEAKREKMKVWPRDNSIRETKDCIIVYLSKPSKDWYEVNGVKK